MKTTIERATTESSKSKLEKGREQGGGQQNTRKQASEKRALRVYTLVILQHVFYNKDMCIQPGTHSHGRSSVVCVRSRETQSTEKF